MKEAIYSMEVFKPQPERVHLPEEPVLVEDDIELGRMEHQRFRRDAATCPLN